MRLVPLPPWRVERTLPWAIVALALLLGIFELTDFDLRVQDALFDVQRNAWRVDGRDLLWRALFYSGPKIVLIGLGIGIFVAALASTRTREALGVDVFTRRSLLVAGLTLATLPALVGALKAVTNRFCPAENQRYGGDICGAAWIERSAVTNPSPRRGRCFPAGHASGGFALLALAGMATTRRGQIGALATAVTVGAAMGGYQMAKGAHYLSHTLVTALLAWIVFLSWRQLLARLQHRCYLQS